MAKPKNAIFGAAAGTAWGRYADVRTRENEELKGPCHPLVLGSFSMPPKPEVIGMDQISVTLVEIYFP